MTNESISRGPHHRMTSNMESIEVLLQTTFGRGIKYLSTLVNDAHYDEYLQLGERICVTSLKTFTVRTMIREYNYSLRD